MSRVEGADELIKGLRWLGDNANKVERRMIKNGGDVMAGAWQYTIGQKNLIRSGLMHDNVKSKVRSVHGVLRAEITSVGEEVRTVKRGKNKGKTYTVRNAAKAYILHYGTSRIKATHWIASAEDMGMPLAHDIMEDVLSEVIEEAINKY